MAKDEQPSEHATTRARLAQAANEVARLSRRPGAPQLFGTSARELVLQWLQWNDPNGIHTDELARAESIWAVHSEQSAWDEVARVVADSLED